MDINSLLSTDEELKVIDEGTWVKDIADAPGMQLKVTGWGAKRAQKLLEGKKIAARKKNRNKELSNDQGAQITREVLAEVVLQDWAGITDSGKEVPYSIETATKWLTSRNGERFAAIVLDAALEVDANANEFVEAVEKKSAPASNGG